MNQKDQEAFYTGAAIYLNLDSIEVDELLATRGLSTEFDSVKKCTAVIKAAYPDRWAKVLERQSIWTTISGVWRTLTR
jgi:hypothetical protein